MFRVVGTLLSKQETVLHNISDLVELSNKFAKFFSEKVRKLRAGLDETDCGTLCNQDTRNVSCNLCEFHSISSDILLKLIKLSPPRSCILYPIPTSLLKNSDTLDELLPLLTKSVNSLSSGDVPVSLKQAAVGLLTLLKKQGWDSEQMKNYRPVSNLPYVSKLLEEVVANQIMTYVYSNYLHEPLQSTYRPGHSTEIAMQKIKKYIDVALDQGDGVLVLLDLSAAFDAIDHKIMLSRLKSYCGITGNALNHIWK